MENKQIGTVILAFLIGIGGLLGVQQLSEDVLDDVYICPVSQEIGQFARLSGTAYTAYPNQDDGKSYRRCTDGSVKGKWLSLVDYADQNGIDLYELLGQANVKLSGIPAPANPENVPQYLCGKECVVK